MTARKGLATARPREAKVLVLVIQAADGIKIAEIIKAIGGERSTILRYLQHYRADGVVAMAGDGPTSRWCLTERLDAAAERVRLDHEKTEKGRRKLRRAIHGPPKPPRIPKPKAQPEENYGERPFVHAVVAAADARPLQKRGPASVFELGAMA